jgi:DNA-binding NtrC family response regulator
MNTKPQVLIVDSEENWYRQHLQRLFDAEFNISYARNYREATEIISKAERPFDILITEISYDEMKQDEAGFELISYLEKKRTYTQVIILTRYGTITNTKRALKNPGIHDLQLKTPEDGSEFNPYDFLQIVKDALAKIDIGSYRVSRRFSENGASSKKNSAENFLHL